MLVAYVILFFTFAAYFGVTKGRDWSWLDPSHDLFVCVVATAITDAMKWFKEIALEVARARFLGRRVVPGR